MSFFWGLKGWIGTGRGGGGGEGHSSCFKGFSSFFGYGLMYKVGFGYGLTVGSSIYIGGGGGWNFGTLTVYS